MDSGTTSSPPSENSLQILLLNVHNWHTAGGTSNVFDFVKYARDSKCDIIACTEDSGGSKEVAVQLDMTPYSTISECNLGNSIFTNSNWVQDYWTTSLSYIDFEPRTFLRINFRKPEIPPMAVFLTHLEHTSEPMRLYQLNYGFETIINGEENQIILGDFNALTKSDYTEEYLGEITNTRYRSRWELPVFDVTNFMLEKQYVDFYQKINKMKEFPAEDYYVGTCRYNTRIDYIWISKDLSELIDWENSSCEIDRKCNLSDHYPIIARIVFKKM